MKPRPHRGKRRTSSCARRAASSCGAARSAPAALRRRPRSARKWVTRWDSSNCLPKPAAQPGTSRAVKLPPARPGAPAGGGRARISRAVVEATDAAIFAARRRRLSAGPKSPARARRQTVRLLRTDSAGQPPQIHRTRNRRDHHRQAAHRRARTGRATQTQTVPVDRRFDGVGRLRERQSGH